MDRSYVLEWMTQAGEALSSPTALWAYSWSAIGLAFVLSITLATYQLRIIRDFNRADLVRTFRGRGPERPKSIRRRIRDLKLFRNKKFAVLAARAALMLMFGIVVPGGLLIVIALNQGWLFPGEPALLINGTLVVGSDVGPLGLAPFVIDQALRGGLTDLFEVFDFSVSAVTNNPNNILFSTLVLGFRFVCGAVVVGLIVMIGRVILGGFGLAEKIEALEQSLSNAQD